MEHVTSSGTTGQKSQMFFDRDSFDFGTAKTDMGLYRQQLEMHIIREIVSDRVIIITAKK